MNTWLGKVVFNLAYQCGHLKIKILVINWKGGMDIREATSEFCHKKHENQFLLRYL